MGVFKTTHYFYSHYNKMLARILFNKSKPGSLKIQELLLINRDLVFTRSPKLLKRFVEHL